VAWSLKWGDHVKVFEIQFKKTGIKPAALKSRPALEQADLPYYQAFSTLDDSRLPGFHSVSPILVSEVWAYCQLMGIVNQRLRSKYLSLVKAMDKVCLNHWAEYQKQQKSKQ
jgi:hypothetical protein